jgi:cell division protein FtsQ
MHQAMSELRQRPNRKRKDTPEPAAPPRLGLGARLRGRVSRSLLGRLRRPLWYLTRGLLLVCATAGAVSGGRLLERYVRSAQAFEARELHVTGNARLSREEVLKQAGLALGRNVFEVSPEQARASLLEHPWIVEATVSRRLPSSYRIELREQSPAALLMLEKLYLVGEDGTVFKPLDPGDPVDLPVITGVDPAEFRSDLALRSSLLVSAVGLLQD